MEEQTRFKWAVTTKTGTIEVIGSRTWVDPDTGSLHVRSGKDGVPPTVFGRGFWDWVAPVEEVA